MATQADVCLHSTTIELICPKDCATSLVICTSFLRSELERRLSVSGSTIMMSCLADARIEFAFDCADAMMEVAGFATLLVNAEGSEHFDFISLTIAFA